MNEGRQPRPQAAPDELQVDSGATGGTHRRALLQVSALKDNSSHALAYLGPGRANGFYFWRWSSIWAATEDLTEVP